VPPSIHSPGTGRRIGSLAVLFVLTTAPAFAQATTKRSLILASGAPQGIYFPLAQDIARVARQAGIDVQAVPSQGSIQNLAWLAERRVDLALAQSDAAFDAYHGRGSFAQPIQSIRAVTPLYTEAVHILVRKPLYIRRVEELRGKRIAVGPQGSGTESTAAAVLAAAGVTLAEVSLRHLGVEETMAAMRHGDLDAAFLMSGVPSEAVTSVLADGTASLLEPTLDLLERLREVCPFFLSKNIEPTDYPGLTEEVTTPAVQALLVGRSDLDHATVERLIRALSDKNLTKKYHLTDVNGTDGGIAIPVFEVTQPLSALTGLKNRSHITVALLFAAAFLLIGLLSRPRLWGLVHRKNLLRFSLYFLVVWISGSFALYWREHRFNDNYSSPWISLWSGLITIFSLSNKEPLTVEGRVIAVALFLLGIGVIAWFTKSLAFTYIERKILPLLRGGFAKAHKMKDHYVIAGWNTKGPGILAQLHDEDFDNHRPIVILAKEEQAKTLSFHGSIYIEKGDPASEEALRRVRIQAAHSVIVLADADDTAADARTILTILAIRKICGAQTPNRQVPVIAEIFDSGNVELAKYAGGEHGSPLEIVSSNELGEHLLTHAAVNPGLTNVYRELLTFAKDSSEIHRGAVPKKFVSKSFGELACWASEQRQHGVYVIPIAILREHKLFLNPTSSSDLGNLQKDDLLFALCDSAKDLAELSRAGR